MKTFRLLSTFHVLLFKLFNPCTSIGEAPYSYKQFHYSLEQLTAYFLVMFTVKKEATCVFPLLTTIKNS